MYKYIMHLFMVPNLYILVKCIYMIVKLLDIKLFIKGYSIIEL